MKKTILSIGIVVCALLVKAQDPANAPKIEFKSSVIDYGTIEHNADGNREFEFTNTGKEPLLITNCQGSCGCTVPTWPKEPIMPGKKGSIKVKYATDRIGAFEKTVTVTSNALNTTEVLRIKGVVKPDAVVNTPAAPVAPPAQATPAPAKATPAPAAKPK